MKPWIAHLGRGVVGLAAVAERGDAREVEDLAVLLLDEVLLGGPGHQERTAQVDAHDQVPVLVGHLEQQVVAGDAGVVDQHVDPAELVDDPRDRGLDGLGVADVGADADGLRVALQRQLRRQPRRPRPRRGRRSRPRRPPRRTGWRTPNPMPRAAPVTTATRPSYRPMGRHPRRTASPEPIRGRPARSELRGPAPRRRRGSGRSSSRPPSSTSGVSSWWTGSNRASTERGRSPSQLVACSMTRSLPTASTMTTLPTAPRTRRCRISPRRFSWATNV